MENLQKEFIPFELSLKMKQLGFDEPCMYYVDEQNNSFIYNFQTHPDEFIEWCGVTVISTPLYQQCFRWFREKYNLKGYVEPVEYLDGTPDTYHWSIFNNCNSGNDQLTHEEAELECLKKLIQIIENK